MLHNTLQRSRRLWQAVEITTKQWFFPLIWFSTIIVRWFSYSVSLRILLFILEILFDNRSFLSFDNGYCISWSLSLFLCWLAAMQTSTIVLGLPEYNHSHSLVPNHNRWFNKWRLKGTIVFQTIKFALPTAFWMWKKYILVDGKNTNKKNNNIQAFFVKFEIIT